MLLAPIIFGIVVVSIAKMGSIKEVGRIGLKGLIYIVAVASTVGELMDDADPPRNVVFTSSWRKRNRKPVAYSHNLPSSWHNFSTLS